MKRFKLLKPCSFNVLTPQEQVYLTFQAGTYVEVDGNTVRILISDKFAKDNYGYHPIKDGKLKTIDYPDLVELFVERRQMIEVISAKDIDYPFPDINPDL